MSIDKELIAAVNQACNGQEEGFNALYKRTYPCVYFRAKQLLSKEEDIQDLIQDVYIEVYRSIGKLNNINSLYPWLKQITYHMATKMYRKRTDALLNEEDQTVFEMIETGDIATLPELTSEMKATSQLVSELINELPDLQKTALIAYYFDEFSVNKVAEMMECSVGTIKSRLNYARQALKAKVLEREKREGILLHSIDFTILYWAVKYLEDNTELSDFFAQNIYQNVCVSVGLKTVISQGSIMPDITIAQGQTINQSAATVNTGVKGASLFSKIAAMGTGAKTISLIGAVLITTTVVVGSRMILSNIEDAKTKQDVKTMQSDESEEKRKDITEIIKAENTANNIMDNTIELNETVEKAGIGEEPVSDQPVQENPYSRMIKFNYNDECIIYYPIEWGSNAGSKNNKVYFYDDGNNYITFDKNNFTSGNIIAFSTDLDMGSYSYYEMDTDSGQKIYVTENVSPDNIDFTAYIVDLENKRQYELNAFMLNDFYKEHIELVKTMAKSMSIIAEGYINYNQDNSAAEPDKLTDINTTPEVSTILKAYYEFLIIPIIYKDEFIYGDNLSFSIVDINHDGIPELVLDKVDNFGMAIEQILYTYYNGKVVPIGDYGHGAFLMYESGDIFSGVSVSQGYLVQNIYQIKDDKMEEVGCIYSDAGTGTENPTTTYYLSERQVDQAAFEAFMKDHTGSQKSGRYRVGRCLYFS